ncbi:MAG: N-acetylmuramoyl-L-alanine amidase [Methanoregulaceae archaeon]|nr:N-acetylmuramoyl-L-alanine amidase [Methanoregulaceae archaeon]
MIGLLLGAWLAPPVICIDPGHPSENGVGTRGKVLTELEVCWQVAVKLKGKLQSDGYTVVMTKPSMREKVTNKRRAEIANKAGAALMLRLHCDAGTGRGFASYYPDRAGKVGKVSGPPKFVLDSSKRAAAPFHAAAVAVLKGHLPNAGLKTDRQTMIGGKQGALTGSIYARVPTVLVEMCVLQSAKDEAFMRSKQGYEIMAEALRAGVRAAVQFKGPPKG